jgi:hypothetical protein
MSGPTRRHGAGKEDDAVVVFSGRTDLPWLRLLKPGFRHCFVLLRRGGAWVVIDPLAHYTRVDLVPASLARTAEEVAAAYRDAGVHAVGTAVREPPARLAPLRPATCVETVKRVLGLRAPAVVTPWQLWTHLNRSLFL